MNRREAIRLKPNTIIYRADKRTRRPIAVGKVIITTKRGGILVERLEPYEHLRVIARKDWLNITHGKEWWGYIGVFIL